MPTSAKSFSRGGARRPTRLLTLAIPTLLAAGLLATVAQPAVAARRRTCRSEAGTVANDSGSRVWHRGSALYSCVVLGYAVPRTRRIGTWASGTRVFLEGIDVAWTTPRRTGGVTSDRISAANMYTGARTMTGLPLVPASGAAPAREGRLQTLVGVDSTALAWTTQAGDVVMALDGPQDDPVATGVLPSPLFADGHRLLVASYPGSDASGLASGLYLFPLAGDGDECDTVSGYAVTFVDPSRHATGALWTGDAHNPQCGGR